MGSDVRVLVGSRVGRGVTLGVLVGFGLLVGVPLGVRVGTAVLVGMGVNEAWAMSVGAEVLVTTDAILVGGVFLAVTMPLRVGRGVALPVIAEEAPFPATAAL